MEVFEQRNDYIWEMTRLDSFGDDETWDGSEQEEITLSWSNIGL